LTTLNRDAIILRLKSSSKKRLVVTPILCRSQIGPGSIDVRLGPSIVDPQKTYVESQDATDAARLKQAERRLYEKVRLKYNSKFVLHPNQVILGGTFEYILLPSDLSCTIASRSSWGRLGLVVATASIIQPGYRGCLTLELVNLSESPIALYPGLMVGQLVFSEVKGPSASPTYDKVGRYDCPTEPEPPLFFQPGTDDEIRFWGKKSSEVQTPDPKPPPKIASG
jgi:dCTP deaminase